MLVSASAAFVCTEVNAIDIDAGGEGQYVIRRLPAMRNREEISDFPLGIHECKVREIHITITCLTLCEF